MIILIQGLEDVEYKNASGREVKGVTVYGIVTEEDEDRPKLTGHRVFEQFFTGRASSDYSVGQEYELKFVIKKFKGEYHAYPDSLELVE